MANISQVDQKNIHDWYWKIEECLSYLGCQLWLMTRLFKFIFYFLMAGTTNFKVYGLWWLLSIIEDYYYCLQSVRRVYINISINQIGLLCISMFTIMTNCKRQSPPLMTIGYDEVNSLILSHNWYSLDLINECKRLDWHYN